MEGALQVRDIVGAPQRLLDEQRTAWQCPLCAGTYCCPYDPSPIPGRARVVIHSLPPLPQGQVLPELSQKESLKT